MKPDKEKNASLTRPPQELNKRTYLLAQVCVDCVYVYINTIKALYLAMPWLPDTISCCWLLSYWAPASKLLLPSLPGKYGFAMSDRFASALIELLPTYSGIDEGNVSSCFCACCQQKQTLSFIVGTKCRWGMSGLQVQVLGIWKWKGFPCVNLVSLNCKRNRRWTFLADQT